MTVRMLRYPKEEFARRGDDIYNRDIRPQVDTDENKGKFVAIDIETGAWEMAQNTLAASQSLFQRLPDAQLWYVRIGHRAVYRIGVRSLVEAR